MAEITLRVIDGADRGRSYEGAPTPITIGREEGNTIQLNDERISRFHAKIQEDQQKLVLTDLDSTNGTKVNGEDVQLRILRYGDVIAVGRSLLLFGSRDQIADRLRQLRGDDVPTPAPRRDDDDDDIRGDDLVGGDGALEQELSWAQDSDVQKTLHALLPPDLPEGLGPGQAAQLSELIEYLHLTVRDLIQTVRLDGDTGPVTLDFRQWQAVVNLQSRLSEYLRKIGDPDLH